MQRLALPRFLFREGERALGRQGAYGHALGTSLLQDAVEAFLRVLVDVRHINVGANAPFNKLLGDVSTEFEVVRGYRATLSNLNNARVAFKHHGLSVPDQGDASTFLVNVRDFLTDVTHEAFGVDFASVSLIDAIGHRRTQNWLRKAEQALTDGEHEEAMCQVAGAFAIYLAHRTRSAASAPSSADAETVALVGWDTPVSAESRTGGPARTARWGPCFSCSTGWTSGWR